MRGESRQFIVIVAFAGMLAVLGVGRLCIGSSGVGWPSGELASWVLHARLHRLVVAVIVGIALATSGVALQALLRNPLAEPYILGLSTGAAAGVMAQSLVLYFLGIAFGPGYLGALLGAGLSMLIVFLAGRRRGLIDPLGLLLTGVVLGTINGAIIMLLNYLVGPGGLRDDLARWMMGYLNEGLSWLTIAVITGGVLAAAATLQALARPMDIATLSQAEAHSLGVNLAQMRMLLFLTASVLAAGAVVLAGPIAFVGLISPHIARLLLGPRHRTLLIGSALIGASLIVLADITSSFIALQLGIGMIPIGVFTAMVGGPAFLWMLRPQLGRGMP